MSSTPAPIPPFQSPSAALPEQKKALLAEIIDFSADCRRRYRFNNSWDVVLSVLGILLSIAIVAAGFLKWHAPETSAILGAIVGALITAQKAFPFGQRARFYRLLIGQADNLRTCLSQDFWNTQQAISVLTTLRMDFAQELPRGTTSAQDGDPAPDSAHKPPGGALPNTTGPQHGQDPATPPGQPKNQPPVQQPSPSLDPNTGKAPSGIPPGSNPSPSVAGVSSSSGSDVLGPDDPRPPRQ